MKAPPLRTRPPARAFAGKALSLAALLTLAAPARSAAAPMPFPPGAAIVDVTQPPFNADPTGLTDSTAAIQLAINRASYDGVAGDGIADDGIDDGWQDGSSRSRPRIIYFPAGVYLVSDTLAGPALNDLMAGGSIMLRGESRTASILRLAPGAPGFNNPATPKPVFTNFRGNTTNNAFMNSVENLTIETGAGNPGAIALEFTTNNTGHIRGVTIRSLDPARSGVAGINLCPGSDPGNPTGIGLVQDVAIEGFAIGIDTSRGFHMPWVLDRVSLSHQTNTGILNANRPLSICSLTSNNSVPALRSTGPGGHIVIVNSSLTGGSPEEPAIDLLAGFGLFRNISSSGYSTPLRVAGVNHQGSLSASERVVGPVLKLWDTTPSRSLNLPIADAPEIPWDTADGWAVVPPPANNEAADTAAIQSALNSGKPSILLQPGTYAINSTLLIGPAVRRIHGNWATLRLHSAFRIQDVPVFRLASSNHPAVVLEKIQGLWADSAAYLIHHESPAGLILRDIFWVAGPVYRNTPGPGGRLFIENVHSLGGSQIPRENRPAFIFDHQEVWARQINPEMQHPHIINDGGRLVILGFKTGEQRGPVVITRNGGSTEILGGVQNQTHDDPPADPDSTAILEVENASLSASLVERFEGLDSAWGNNALVARETRGAETRTLRPPTVWRATGNTAFTSPVPVRAGQLGAAIPLFVGYQNGAVISPLVPTLREDSGPAAAFVVSRDTASAAGPLTLYYSVSGTAVSGADFEPLPGSVTIPAGQSTATITVTPVNRSALAATRTLTLTLNPHPSYTLSPAASASIEIVPESLVHPPAISAMLAADSSSAATVTIFNPDPSPKTYTLTGITTLHTASHRELQPGDYSDLPDTKTELFTEKPQDDAAVNVTLPFPFPFFGASYSQARVTTNGFISFNTSSAPQANNTALPSASAPRAMIAWYWDDLYFDSQTKCWHATAGTDNNGSPDAWILEVQDATTYATRNNSIPERISARLWLFRDGGIRIVFLQSTIQAVSYTIGIQNWEQNQAINLVYNGSAPSRAPSGPLPPPYRAQAGTTVLFSPPITWASLSTQSLPVPAAGQASFTVNLTSTPLNLGDFRSTDLLLTDGQTTQTLPISLLVTTAPATPGSLTATPIAHDQIRLTWADVQNETGFRLEHSPGGASAWTLLADLPANTTTFTHTGLPAETTRFYRIRASNPAGDSQWSEPASATTPPAPPPPASGLTATLLPGNAIRLDWTDNSDNETAFVIERSRDGGSTFTPLATLPPNTTTWLDANLPARTAFLYRVTAFNGPSPAPASNSASAATPVAAIFLSPADAQWLRGRAGSAPPSEATLTGADLVLFSGGSNNSTDTQTPVWAYFPAATLTDGETLRLRATLQITSPTPAAGQGFSIGFVNSNGTKTPASVPGNNPPERRDDAGYGFTLGLGGSTTTRYLHKPAANNLNGPWAVIDNSANTLILGATPATATLLPGAPLDFIFELTRNGSNLEIKALLDGQLYDGGRAVAQPETFTFDSVAIVLRREALSATLSNLTVQRIGPLTPLETWRLNRLGSPTPEGAAADSADPDSDGLPNLLEYALGGGPADPASRPHLTPGAAAVSGRHRLTLSFTPAETQGLRFVVEASSDLSDWTEQTDLADLLTPGQPFTFTDSADLTATPRRFLRLRVTAE